MFLKKLASQEARMVDLRDYPRDGEIHAVNEYPKYYDAIYYPALYDEFFMTAEYVFLGWSMISMLICVFVTIVACLSWEQRLM
jgi:hypothetical protein